MKLEIGVQSLRCMVSRSMPWLGAREEVLGVAACRRLALVFAVVCWTVASFVLIGWAFDLGWPKSVLPGAATMKPTTAGCFWLLGWAAALRSLPGAAGSGFWGNGLARIAAGVVLAEGLLIILAYALGWRAEWDTWFFGEAVRREGGMFPGRMALGTAVGVTLLGLALLLQDVPSKIVRAMADHFALTATSIGYVATACYAYDVEALYDIALFSSLSLPTACLLAGAGAAILGSRSERGIMGPVSSEHIGGWIARRLLPVAFSLPLLLGWLHLLGEKAQWYHAGFGLSLLTTIFALLFALAVWRQAQLLNEKDAERKSAEQMHKRLSAIVESSDDAIIGLELDGTVTSWNRGAERIFGYTTSEMVGQLVHRLLPPDRSAEEWGILARVKRGSMVEHWETLRQRKDGVLVNISVTVSPILNADGEVVGASKVARDISKRCLAERQVREGEARFREIAENINEVFWTFDLSTQELLYISPAFEGIWGYPCTDLSATSKAWRDAIHSEDRQRVEDSFRNQRDTGTYDETYRIMRPDGEFRWIYERTFPIADDSGVVRRCIGLAEDITERRNLEQQLVQTQKLEALGTLAGGIAHDFNNILGAIIGYTDLAKLKSKDPEIERLLDPVSRAGHRAAGLVRQILSFSRRQEAQRAVVQLREIVEEALRLLRATIPASIEFNVSMAPDLPPILADATQIHQVLMNLGTNAWHAMREKASGQLTLNLERFTVDARSAEANLSLREGTYVRVAISDTGTGMDRATMDRIFEPFFTTKAVGEGTGLGLSVVHGIMRNHEGTITVYSHRNQGTTFHLYFPVKAGTEESASLVDAPIPLGDKQRILFVDDEAPLADLGFSILEELGYVVYPCTSPVEALEMVQENAAAYDLLVTDLAMPKLGGLELARMVHELRPDLPIILSSGYMGGLGEKDLADVGIHELLPKPHTMRSVGMTVHRVLRGGVAGGIAGGTPG